MRNFASTVNSDYLVYGTKRYAKTQPGTGQSDLTSTFDSYKNLDKTVFGKNLDDLIDNQEYDYSTSFISASGQTFSTYFSDQGLFCVRTRAGSEKKSLMWSIEYDSDEQAKKAEDFIKKYPSTDKLIFASKEYFWLDFFNGDLNEESFDEFYKWTDHGTVRLNRSDDGEVIQGFNRNKIRDPNAMYFNDNSFIAYACTIDDIEQMQQNQLNSAVKQQFDNDYANRISRDMDTGLINSYDPRHLTTQNRYMRFADVTNTVVFNGRKFKCDFDTDTMTFGDTSDPSDCITIRLYDGGYFTIDLSRLTELKGALDFFSVYDLQLIRAALTEI